MVQKKKYTDLPLVYSCSGCSNTAQLSNQVAVELDREQIAEMSCIAGVGGGVPVMVKKAISGRTIVAIDGCPLHCVKLCLAQYQIESTLHYTLTEHDVQKRQHDNYSPSDVRRIKAKVVSDIQELSSVESA